ncbi:hypothetical protein HYC85_020404 [Camellia sinensis]|uniref:Uncharacterized protein n=1 Tax=Camellia sinensis TaxID=4442 RepID=A0A7J7GPP0_CAMSI|nr:hypothetical protein HYC85_020404 [Camellia sinensis]
MRSSALRRSSTAESDSTRERSRWCGEAKVDGADRGGCNDAVGSRRCWVVVPEGFPQW